MLIDLIHVESSFGAGLLSFSKEKVEKKILALLHKLNTYRVFRDVRPLKVFAGISDICATERFLKEK